MLFSSQASFFQSSLLVRPNSTTSLFSKLSAKGSIRSFAVKELSWCSPGKQNNYNIYKTKKNEQTLSHTDLKHHIPDPPTYFGIIAAMSKNRVIGIDGKLPWKVPIDRTYFEKVANQKVLILGKTTFHESNNGAHVSFARCCIVVSKTLTENPPKHDPTRIHFVSSFSDALGLARHLENTQKQHDVVKKSHEVNEHEKQSLEIDCWIAGGERIYEEALRHKSAQELHLTRIDMDVNIDDKELSSFARFPARYRWDNIFKLYREWEIEGVDMNNKNRSHNCMFQIYHRQRRKSI